MVIQFKVNEQKLSLLSNPWIVGNSYNYVNCQFSFSDDWDGLPKTAIFTNGSREYPVTLNRSDQAKVPWEVLSPEQFYVSVVGGSPNDNMITTNIIAIDVHPSNECHRYDNYNCNRNPTPDIYQQILDLLQDKQDKLVAGENIDISEDNIISGTTDYVDAKVEDINIRLDGLENNIVDTIMYNKDTNELWLSANGEQVGDKVILNGSSRGVSSISINEEGHMIIFYSDGSSEDIGKVTSDYKTYVYVPTIDDRKILTLTLSESPGVESISCDLNPNDEWTEITDEPESSDYIWEEL